MLRLTLVASALALLLPGAAVGAACSPLDCSTSQFVLAHGRMLAVRQSVDKPLRVIDLRTGGTRWHLPPGVVSGRTLVHQDGALLTWYDLATGRRVADAMLQQRGTFSLVGVSQDGASAVVARTQKRSTTFAIASPHTQRVVKLGGNNWSFDALDGRFLFLIQTLRFGYEVRLYDLATNTLRKQPLKDQDRSALISGLPFARVSSPNGRYLFTLYIGGDGNAMVHELDTAAGRAYCIDLPGSGDFAAAATWALVQADDGDNGTLWAVSVGYGRLVAIDVASHRLRVRYSFQRASWNPNAGIAALAPDGQHVAFTDATHVWVADLADGRVATEPSHVAIALGWKTDQSALWVVGERSRVSRLAPLRLR
ncbi:MAG TPA: hypothetical protein VFA05_01685 [Gaiellaceae bacterium]|nr:hypothetical protein [Gaiellaceae bacterium]